MKTIAKLIKQFGISAEEAFKLGLNAALAGAAVRGARSQAPPFLRFNLKKMDPKEVEIWMVQYS